MKIITLASGSHANSTFIESGETRLLIDIGLSGKATIGLLKEIGVLPMSISGIFITHEHKDHCRGLNVFTKKYNVPVYANEKTASAIAGNLPHALNLRTISPTEEVQINGVKIIPFSVPHNSAEPVGYKIIAGRKKTGILTDCGFATNLIKERLKDVDLLIIESNYDEELLKKSTYPWSIKQRISGRLGHLSNSESASLIAEIFKGRPAKVILGHISENTNTPELALEAVNSVLNGDEKFDHEIFQAPRRGVGMVFEL